jgi:hypothetical protein
MKTKKVVRKIQAAIFAIAAFVLSSTGWATTFYVDYANGNNNNNGLSTATPFKHCPGDKNATGKAASTALKAGDVVVFKKGVVYKGTITCSWSGALVATGATASIKDNGLMTDLNAKFQTAGVTPSHYVYIFHSKKSLANTWVESTGLFNISFVQENLIALADFDGVAHSTPEMTYGVVNPIVFKSMASWGSGDAAFDGENTRTIIFDLNGQSYIRFEALKFLNTVYNGRDDWTAAIGGGSSRKSHWIHVVNCEFADLGAVGVNASDYSVVKNCTSRKVAFYGIGTLSEYGLVENNSVYGPGCRSVSTQKHAVIRGNYIKDMTQGFVGHHAAGMGFFDGGPKGDTWYGWIYGNTIDNSVEFIAFYYPNGGPQYWVIHSNIFIGRFDQTGYGDAAITFGGVKNNKIFNNTFCGVGGGGFLNAIRLSSQAIPCSNIEILNNIFYSKVRSAIINIVSGNTQGLIANYNHYFNQSNTPFWYEGVQKTLAEWRNLGLDLQGVANLSTDPNFSSPANLDLHLTANSTYDIAAGANLSQYFTRDKDGRSRPRTGKFSLGAYDYVAALNNRPSPPKNLRILPGQ